MKTISRKKPFMVRVVHFLDENRRYFSLFFAWCLLVLGLNRIQAFGTAFQNENPTLTNWLPVPAALAFVVGWITLGPPSTAPSKTLDDRVLAVVLVLVVLATVLAAIFLRIEEGPVSSVIFTVFWLFASGGTFRSSLDKEQTGQ